MTSDRILYGKDAPAVGEIPAVILINPKFAHNVGASVRAASCFGVSQVWFTGDRIKLDEGERLPREERMKGYDEVQLIQFDYPFDAFEGAVPIAVELRADSEPLHSFDHPPNAVYVFGPEDGSIRSPILNHCHRFVVIPTRHCVNLAAAVYLTLYDRAFKRWITGDPMPELAEERG